MYVDIISVVSLEGSLYVMIMLALVLELVTLKTGLSKASSSSQQFLTIPSSKLKPTLTL